MNVLRILMTFVLLVCSGNVSANNNYDLTIGIYNAGELIANPELTVTEGEQSDIQFSLSGNYSYHCSVVVRNAADNKVNVALSFESDQVSLNREFQGVLLGEATLMTTGEVEVKVLVKRASSEEK